MNTLFDYSYRDGSGYQEGTSLILPGTITPAQFRRIEASLDEGQFFVATQVGLPDVSKIALGFMPTEMDHNWATLDLEYVKPIDKDPTFPLPVAALVRNFVACKPFWDENELFLPSEAELGGMYLLDEYEEQRPGAEFETPADAITVWAAVYNPPGRSLDRYVYSTRREAEAKLESLKANTLESFAVWGEAYTAEGWEAANQAWDARGYEQTQPGSPTL